MIKLKEKKNFNKSAKDKIRNLKTIRTEKTKHIRNCN